MWMNLSIQKVQKTSENIQKENSVYFIFGSPQIVDCKNRSHDSTHLENPKSLSSLDPLQLVDCGSCFYYSTHLETSRILINFSFGSPPTAKISRLRRLCGSRSSESTIKIVASLPYFIFIRNVSNLVKWSAEQNSWHQWRVEWHNQARREECVLDLELLDFFPHRIASN